MGTNQQLIPATYLSVGHSERITRPQYNVESQTAEH